MKAHSHAGEARSAGRRRLGAALILAGTFFAVELAGGWISGSLALLADAGHMFTDLGGLLLAYAAMTLAGRRPSGRYTFGYYRAEILAAFVNAEVLLLIAGYVFYEAVQRFRQPPEIATGLMLGVAVAGLLANIAAIALLHGHRGTSLNVRAAYLEVVTDAVSSVGVVAAALLMEPTGWWWLDPAVSIGIALFIVPRAIGILRESGHILLEGTPRHIDLSALRREILDVDGVEALHDLHFWTLTSGKDCSSVHLQVGPDADPGTVQSQVRRVLSTSAGIDHATIQIEEGAANECPAEDTHGRR